MAQAARVSLRDIGTIIRIFRRVAFLPNAFVRREKRQMNMEYKLLQLIIDYT